MSVELHRAGAREPVGDGMTSRTIFGDSSEAWTRPVIMEWELTGAQWTDRHPHDEFNVVLEGELHVECDGETVVARPGDMVRVLAHSQGRYFAPGHARMLAIYDHNPDGVASSATGPEPVPPTAG
ncbi:cupin domain-containing protein [Nocardioides sp.]|uniref:cupin domain-containing protein n=1 Tax=Nocardioides sp. TaxID=35761 RepID=UPI003D0D8C0D